MLRSIRWTLQLWHAGILALALVVLGGAFDVGLRREQLGRVDAGLEGAARVLASGPMGPMSPREGRRGGGPPPNPSDENLRGASSAIPESPPHDGDSPRGDKRQHGGPPMDWWNEVPQNALRRLGASEQDQPYFVIWDREGKVLRASSPELKAPESTGKSAPSPDRGSNTPAEFRQLGEFREVILSGPFGIGVLVGKSMRTENATIATLRLQILGAGLAVLAVGLCGGWMLSKRIIRPIKTISDTAQLISGSDLSQRIAVTEISSELGSLAQTLNETFNRLETAFGRQVRFTADASHELRTPLSVIHSHAELALAKPRSV